MSRTPSPERTVRRAAFARDFSEAVQRSGFTLGDISRRLQESQISLSVATLSYWQRGRSMPTRGSSLRTLALLEHMLNLPAGQLQRHTTGEVGWFPEKVRGSGTLEEMIEELGLSRERQFELLAVADELVLDPDRRRGTQRVRQYMRVAAEQASALTLALSEERGPAPTVTAVAGGVVERVRHNDAEGLTVAALDLHRPLARGEQFWVEYQVRWNRDEDIRDEAIRLVAGLCSVMSMDVVFTGEPPRSAHYDCTPAEDAPGRNRELAVVGNRVQLVVSDAIAGEHAVRWQW